jgi:hypothetical protein
MKEPALVAKSGSGSVRGLWHLPRRTPEYLVNHCLGVIGRRSRLVFGNIQRVRVRSDLGSLGSLHEGLVLIEHVLSLVGSHFDPEERTDHRRDDAECGRCQRGNRGRIVCPFEDDEEQGRNCDGRDRNHPDRNGEETSDLVDPARPSLIGFIRRHVAISVRLTSTKVN